MERRPANERAYLPDPSLQLSGPGAVTPSLARGSSRISFGSNVTTNTYVSTPPPERRHGTDRLESPRISHTVGATSSAGATTFLIPPESQAGGPSGAPSGVPSGAPSVAASETAHTSPSHDRRLSAGLAASAAAATKAFFHSEEKTELQLQRSHFWWLERADESRGLHDISHATITAKELAMKYGVPGDRIADYLRQEIAEQDACLSLPFTLIMVIAYACAVLMHDPGVSINSVEDSVLTIVENNMRYAYTGPGVAHKKFDNINSHTDFWSWLVRGFVPVVFEQEYPLSEGLLTGFGDKPPTGVAQPVPREDWTMFLHYNRIIGGLRFSQEVSKGTCEGPDILRDFWSGERHDCVGGELGYELDPEMWDAYFTKNPEREFWLWAREPVSSILEQVYQAELAPWLQPDTSKIEIAIPVFNAEYRIYTLVFVNFWFSRGGRIWKRVIPMSTYSSWWHGPLNIAADAIWLACMLWITVYEAIRIRSVYRLGGFKQLRTEYINFWTITDWCSVVISIAMVTLFVLRLVASSDLNTRLMNLAILEDQPDAFRPLVMDFVKTLDTEVHRAYEMRIFLGVYPMINIVRLFKAFAAQPRLAIVTKTLYASSVDLFHFLLVFGSIFVTAAVSGQLLFGNEVDAFTTLGRAMITLFRACVISDFEYGDWDNVGREQSGLFFALLMSVLTMLMLNMLLAIVMETYSEQKAKLEAADTLVDETWQAYYRWKGIRKGTHLRLQSILRSITVRLAGWDGAPPARTSEVSTSAGTADVAAMGPKRSFKSSLKKAGTKESIESVSQNSVTVQCEDTLRLITVDLMEEICPGLQSEQAMDIFEAVIMRIFKEDRVDENTEVLLRDIRRLDASSRKLRRKVEQTSANRGIDLPARRSSLDTTVTVATNASEVEKMHSRDTNGDKDQAMTLKRVANTDEDHLPVFMDELSHAAQHLFYMKNWIGDYLEESGYAQMAVVGPINDPTIADQPFQSLDELPEWGVAKVLSREDVVLNACRLAGIGRENDAFRVQSLGRMVRILQKDEEDNTVKCRVPNEGDVWMALAALSPVPQPGVDQHYVDGVGGMTAETSGPTSMMSPGGGNPFMMDPPLSPQVSSALAPSEETVKRAAELVHELKVGKHTITEAMKALQELQARQWKEQEEKARVVMKFQQLKKKVVSLTKEHRRMQDELHRLDERTEVVSKSRDEYMELVHTTLDENQRLRDKLQSYLGGGGSSSAARNAPREQRLALELPLSNRYRPAHEVATTETSESVTGTSGTVGLRAEYGTLMDRVQQLVTNFAGPGEAPNGRAVSPPRHDPGRRDSSSGSSEMNPARIMRELGQLRNEVEQELQQRGADPRRRDRRGESDGRNRDDVYRDQRRDREERPERVWR